MKSFLAGLVILTGIISARAFAGHEFGHGGTAWTCRDASTGALIRAELIEVIELYASGQPPAQELMRWSDRDAAAFAARLDQKFSQARSFFLITSAQESLIRDSIRSIPAGAKWVSAPLPLTDDWGVWGGQLARPQDILGAWCLGKVALEQVALDPLPESTDRQFSAVLVNEPIYRALSPASQAALWIHEAIYRYRREACGDNDSWTTRNATIQMLSGDWILPFDLSCRVAI